MYRGLIYVGRRGIALHAISGIDIALWDIKGKALGKPVCELIGTPQRDRVRAYASMLMPDEPGEVRERVSALREQGFTAVKLGWGPLGADADQDVELAAAAVEAAGDGGTILIDAGLGYGSDAKKAIGVARELEELGVFWLEEPFEPDEYEAYAELADAVEIRVAAGEQDTTLWGFRELIERGHVDLVQPDVTRCGGITELLRIAEFAHERGVETVPARLEERHHQGRVAARERRAARRAVPGVLRRRDARSTRSLTTRAPADRRRRVRRRADRPRARRRARHGRARALPRRLERRRKSMATTDAEHRRRRARRRAPRA